MIKKKINSCNESVSEINLTDLIGGGTVEGVHRRGVCEPPGTQTHTNTHTYCWRDNEESQEVKRGTDRSDHSLRAWDALSEPADVRLGDKLQRLHHIPVVVCLTEL